MIISKVEWFFDKLLNVDDVQIWNVVNLKKIAMVNSKDKLRLMVSPSWGDVGSKSGSDIYCQWKCFMYKG